MPVEIVNSIQEVIKDSAPGAAVERMREDLDEIRVSFGRQVTESLRGLVVDLAEQVANSLFNGSARSVIVSGEEVRSNTSNKRELEIVRKGIERAEKKLRQIISVNLSSKNISLIRKHKDD